MTQQSATGLTAVSYWLDTAVSYWLDTIIAANLFMAEIAGNV